MTLCELATARHYAPPLECAAFAKGQVPSGHTQAECVEYAHCTLSLTGAAHENNIDP